MENSADPLEPGRLGTFLGHPQDPTQPEQLVVLAASVAVELLLTSASAVEHLRASRTRWNGSATTIAPVVSAADLNPENGSQAIA